MLVNRILSGLLALVLLLLFIPMNARAAEGVAIDKTNFPDENFREYLCEAVDANGDGMLDLEEIGRCSVMDISHRYIQDLTGIAYFGNLTSLDCSYNQLTNLDVSACTKLTSLSCGDNLLTDLNVKVCAALTTIDCRRNDLSRLDVSGLTALEYLKCDNENEAGNYGGSITSLNVSGCTALKQLECGGNPMTSLDVSECTALTSLDCSSRNIDNESGSSMGYITNLNVSGCTALTELNANGNRLTRLDLSKCTALTELYVYYNRLTSLDVSKNTELVKLDCSANQLARLDVSKNIKLTGLDCGNNKLTSLNISKNTKLRWLDCDGNKLTKLDLSKNTKLEGLDCNNNQLEELDVSKNIKLTGLGCGTNRLTSLDVSKNTELEQLDCDNNLLTELDLRKNTALRQYSCNNNQMTSTPLGCHLIPNCDDNQYTIKLGEGRTFDLSKLPGSFDVKKASNWTGGSVKKNILTVKKGAKKVTYEYDSGYWYDRYSQVTFTLLIYDELVATLNVSNRSSDGAPALSWTTVDGAKSYQVYRATSKSGTYSRLSTTTKTSMNNTSTDAGKTYYYKVRAVLADDTKTNYSNIVSCTCDLPRPSITLSTNSSTGKTKISWKAIDGAEEYKVYYATSKNGTYKRLTTTNKTYTTHTSAKAGTTYYYKVKAIHENSAANSAYSSYKYRTCDLPRPDVEIALKKGDPRLTWDKIDGARKYEIYRATSKDGKFTLLKTVTGTSFTNTSAKAGKTYYYKVKAIHSKSAANSAYSSTVSIKAK